MKACQSAWRKRCMVVPDAVQLNGTGMARGLHLSTHLHEQDLQYSNQRCLRCHDVNLQTP